MTPEVRTTSIGGKLGVPADIPVSELDPPEEEPPPESDDPEVPMPDSVAETAPSAVATSRLADRKPVSVGSNSTSIVHEEKPVMVPPEEQVPPDTVKSLAPLPVTVIPPESIVRFAAPAFATERIRVLDVLEPMALEPKDRDDGLIEGDATAVHCANSATSEVMARDSPCEYELPVPTADVFHPANAYPVRARVPAPSIVAVSS